MRLNLHSMSVACIAIAVLLLFGASGAATNAQGNSPGASKGDTGVDKPVEQIKGPPQSVVNADPPPDFDQRMYDRTSTEIMLTVLVIILAIAALAMQFFLLKTPSKIKPEESLRVFGVTLIIMGTLFFITAGYDSQQIAPAMGLFGIIAGYLLGQNNRRETKKDA